MTALLRKESTISPAENEMISDFKKGYVIKDREGVKVICKDLELAHDLALHPLIKQSYVELYQGLHTEITPKALYRINERYQLIVSQRETPELLNTETARQIITLIQVAEGRQGSSSNEEHYKWMLDSAKSIFDGNLLF